MQESVKTFDIPEEERLTDERIQYLIENRQIHTRGFDFGTGVPTSATLAFPQKVEELFALSGITNAAQQK